MLPPKARPTLITFYHIYINSEGATAKRGAPLTCCLHPNSRVEVLPLTDRERVFEVPIDPPTTITHNAPFLVVLGVGLADRTWLFHDASVLFSTTHYNFLQLFTNLNICKF